MRNQNMKKKIEKITSLIKRIDSFKEEGQKSNKLKRWQSEVENNLQEIYGKDGETNFLKEFKEIQYVGLVSISAEKKQLGRGIQNDRIHQKTFKEGLKKARLILMSIIKDLENKQEIQSETDSEKIKAIKRLSRLRDEITSLEIKRWDSVDVEKWRHDVKTAIQYTFGKGDRHDKEFDRIDFFVTMAADDITDHEEQSAYLRGLENARALLESMIDEIQEYWDEEPDTEKLQTKVELKRLDLSGMPLVDLFKMLTLGQVWTIIIILVGLIGAAGGLGYKLRDNLATIEIERIRLESEKCNNKQNTNEIPLIQYTKLNDIGRKLFLTATDDNPVNIKIFSEMEKLKKEEVQAQADFMSQRFGWVDVNGNFVTITKKGRDDFSTFRDFVFSQAVWGK